MTASLSDRVISPERRALADLRTPLTSGELAVVEFFDRALPNGWEIYVQPHLNGLRPDVVLMHPTRGLAVFEVKDWHLSKLDYEYRTSSKGAIQLWSREHTGPWFRQRDEPLAKVIRYRDEIRSLYCPRLGAQLETQPGAAAAITAGLILTQATTKAARALLQPALDAYDLSGTKAAQYNTISGGDALGSNLLSDVFPWAAGGRTSHWMNEDIAADLRSWLIEPSHAEGQRSPLPMDHKQLELATTRTATGYRRIRGPAGSGKSLALAARAAQLSAEGKTVLVVSFNITLLHYLRDLAVRYPDPRRSITDRITWLHFHGWCKRTCEEAGFEEEYKELWRKHFASKSEFEEDDSALNQMLTTDLPSVVAAAIREGTDVTSYDAILCDEGQDLTLDWWNLLRTSLRSGGEMLLAADRTQDLYGHSTVWTETSLENAGFRGGRWFELDGSYRFPVELVPHLRRFVQTFLPDKESASPVAVQGDLLESFRLEWVQVVPGSLVTKAIEIIRSLPQRIDPQKLQWSDLAIVAQTHSVGSDVVAQLEGLGIHACHVFGKNRSSPRWRKSAFWMGDARVKASTLHSFKGWESPHIVVLVSSAHHPSDLRGIYVALSRLRRSAGGSTLLVICEAPELAAYGRSWSGSVNIAH